MDSNSNTVVVTVGWVSPYFFHVNGVEQAWKVLYCLCGAEGCFIVPPQPCTLGFGPFRQYLVNSSWEAVKELSKMGLGSDIDLQIVQLPVSYQKTKELVWKIWMTLQPLLTVHVGLASSSKAIIILEQCGKNKGYKEKDVCGYCPQDGCCLLDGPERIDSTIDMKTLWKTVAVEGIDILFSRDAGGYICDYTYYTSLYYGNRRAAFIHVPPLSKSVTADFLGRVLQIIILEMLKQCGRNRE